MEDFPDKLLDKLQKRINNGALRELRIISGLVDFSSNDYLGFSQSSVIAHRADEIMKEQASIFNGATGSRLLSGNSHLCEETEDYLAKYHGSESALIFNSGYDANIGLFSAILQRTDIVFYDELIHASVRDGIRMSNARAIKFRHNDLIHLEERLDRIDRSDAECYIVTESVYSMNGDMPDLSGLAELALKRNCRLIVDEAHAMGLTKYGLVTEYKLENHVFARVITFGKALGCHGAAILGSASLRQYLINYARSLIYTTALPPHSLASVQAAYEYLESEDGGRECRKLRKNIDCFRKTISELGLENRFAASLSPVQCCLIPGNKNVKLVSKRMAENGFDVRPILSPTVKNGEERLRICLHSFNTEVEIKELLQSIASHLI